MAWHVRVLVIANVTATSPDLLAALQARSERGPIDPTLLMPATGNGFAGRAEAQGRLDEALQRWRDSMCVTWRPVICATRWGKSDCSQRELWPGSVETITSS